jgi:hypothetical protein
MDTPLERAQKEYWKLFGELENWHRQFPAATVSKTPYAQDIIWGMIFWAELVHVMCGKSPKETEDFLSQLLELLGDAPRSPPTQAGSFGNLFFISNTSFLLIFPVNNFHQYIFHTLCRTLYLSSLSTDTLTSKL